MSVRQVKPEIEKQEADKRRNGTGMALGSRLLG
jgi:hypothetical protein